MIVFLIILIVFFFKQKTAYEMRISDWSSDVCSSDLTPSRHRSLAFGVKFVLAFSIANPAILLASWVGGRSGEFTQLYLILAAIAAVAAVVEIGRASCRERVCQYV